MPTGQPGYIKRWSTEAPLRAALLFGFCVLAWFAAFFGLIDIIEASHGQLGLPLKIVVGFAVALIQSSIAYFLLTFFSGTLRLWLWPLYLFGYAFLTLISVGLTFGFFWGLMNASSVQQGSISASLQDIQASLLGARTNLNELYGASTRLAEISAAKAKQELTTGKTCPNSPPGDGQRRRLREEDAARFRDVGTLISGRRKLIDQRLAEHAADLARVLDKNASVINPTTGTYGPFVNSMNNKLRETEAVYNALRTDPIMLSLAAELEARSKKTSFIFGTTQFECPDPALQSALIAVVSAMRGLPIIKINKIVTVEGDKAIFEAVRRLLVSVQREVGRVISFDLAGLLPNSPPSPVPATRQPAKSAAEQGLTEQGLTSDDYGPLGLALLVDMMLFLLASHRAGAGQSERERLGQLVQRICAASATAFGQQRPIPELLEFLHSVQWRNKYSLLPTVVAGSEYSKRALFLQLTFPELEEHRVLKRIGPIGRLFGGLSEPRGKLMLRDAGWENADDIRIIEFFRLNRRLWRKMLREVSGAPVRTPADLMSNIRWPTARGRPMNTQAQPSSPGAHVEFETREDDLRRKRKRGLDEDLV